MNALLAAVREYEPEANYYLEGDGLMCLLVGPSHDKKDKPLQENAACGVYMPNAGGGGW